MSSELVAVLLCTAPDEEVAHSLSRGLVESRLAACVSRTPVQSVYRWEGAVEAADEVQLIIKCTDPEGVMQYVKTHHPYEVPELLVLRAAGGSDAYLGWVVASCQQG